MCLFIEKSLTLAVLFFLNSPLCDEALAPLCEPSPLPLLCIASVHEIRKQGMCSEAGLYFIGWNR